MNLKPRKKWNSTFCVKAKPRPSLAAVQAKRRDSESKPARASAKRRKGLKGKRYGLSKKPRKPLGYLGRLKAGKRLKSRIDRKLVAWSKAVRERDDYTCQMTGLRDVQRNIAHHVAPRGRRVDLKYDIDNGITLTPEAHQWVHDHPIEATALHLLSDETYEAAQKGLKAA